MEKLPNKNKKDYDFPKIKSANFLERNSSALVVLIGVLCFFMMIKYDIALETGLSKTSSIALRWITSVLILYAGTLQFLYWLNNDDDSLSLRKWYQQLRDYDNVHFLITFLSVVAYIIIAISFIVFVTNL